MTPEDASRLKRERDYHDARYEEETRTSAGKYYEVDAVAACVPASPRQRRNAVTVSSSTGAAPVRPPSTSRPQAPW